MAYSAVDAAEGEALLDPEDDDGQEAVCERPEPTRRSGARTATAAGILAAALACVCWLTHDAHRKKVSAGVDFEMKQEQFGPTAQCPQMEVNVEYKDETSGFGQNFDHIPSPDLCCALCQANEQCKSFTWVQDAGLDGNPSQCWIKGGTGIKMPNSVGKVSGVPPARIPVAQVPSGSGSENSMWCFSLMMPTGTEKDLIKWQFNHKASIFACDGSAVYSNQQIEVAPGVVTKVVHSDLKCEYGGDSQSALNSWIFIAVWDKVCGDAEYTAYKWVVKVDPDCVFFPDRLVQILPMYSNAQYLNNCKFGLHGPIEVFSSQAINVLSQEYSSSFDGKSPKRCVENLDFGQWGEDMFVDQCMSKVLGLQNRPLEPRVVCEDHCSCPDFYWCQKGSDRVSYHPFKTVGAYEQCVANALQDQTPAVIAEDLRATAPAR